MEYIISSSESSEGTILENGTMTVLDGGVANSTTVYEGDALQVSSGGTAVTIDGMDYLLTNERLQEETAAMVEMFRARSETWSDEAEKAATVFFSAHEEYLKGAYAKVEEHYGDFEGFIARGLRITPEDREKLRQMYLE